jgi:hypothetical protein
MTDNFEISEKNFSRLQREERRGRPRKEDYQKPEPFVIRLPAFQLAQIDRFRQRYTGMSRAAAIRILIDNALRPASAKRDGSRTDPLDSLSDHSRTLNDGQTTYTSVKTYRLAQPAPPKRRRHRQWLPEQPPASAPIGPPLPATAAPSLDGYGPSRAPRGAAAVNADWVRRGADRAERKP